MGQPVNLNGTYTLRLAGCIRGTVSPKSVNVQAQTQAANLPREVRAVLEAFYRGNLTAGELSGALSRAWAQVCEPERQPVEPSHFARAAEEYATAN